MKDDKSLGVRIMGRNSPVKEIESPAEAVPLTFDNYDCFGLKPFAENLQTSIEIGVRLEDNAFVLGLNAPFGQGKSTFLDMFANYLEYKNFRVIRINAWETEFGEEPLVSIIEALEEDLPYPKEIGKALDTFLIGLNQVSTKFSGIDLHKIAETIKESSVTGSSILKLYKAKKKAYEAIKETLRDIVTNTEKTIIILVDELDRVRPDYAVSFLEAIKHIFSIKGVCFVLAVNRKQLQASVKQLYGEQDFERYYKRFITREIRLPEPHLVGVNNVKKFISKLLTKYEYKESETYFPMFLLELCVDMLGKFFLLTPREIEQLIRELVPLSIMKNSNSPGFSTYEWHEAAATMIAFSIREPELYHKLGKALISPKEMETYTIEKSSALTEKEKQCLTRKMITYCNYHGNESHKRELENIAPAYLENSHSSFPTYDSIVIYGKNHHMNFNGSIFQYAYKALEEWKPLIS